MYWACETDEPFLAQVLIDNGADVNAAESFGFTPLHLAAYLGHANLTRVLINAGASLTGLNNDGSTPLHLAAKQNHFEVVKLIVASGKADLLAKDGTGATAIQLCEKGTETFEILRDRLLEMKRERDANAPPVPGGDRKPSSSGLSEPNSAAASSSSLPAAQSASSAASVEKMTKAIALLTSNIDLERARVAELEKKLAEELLRSQDLLKKGGLSLCMKCQQKVRNRVFIPCMHMYYCGECAKVMTLCESCGTAISGKVPATLQ